MINIINKFFTSSNNEDSINFKLKKLSEVSEIAKIFKLINYYSEDSEVRYVGGCIRRALKNEKIDDIDLATNVDPKILCEILKKNNISFYESGIEHGTITANINNQLLEITTLRKDVSTDGRHASVKFSKNWFEDASRRDFTINSIYSDINGNLFDPFDGKKDLEKGIVKFIGNSEKRIQEDYLRILRYIRFFLIYSKHKHSEELKKNIKKNIKGISKISSERLLDELKKLFLSDGFLKLINDNFCLETVEIIFPQLKNLNIFKNLNEKKKEIIKSKDFIFLLSLSIIDETDNCDYFVYKYNLSNENKKKIKFFQKYCSKKIDKYLLDKKNLKKILYFYQTEYLIDLIDFCIIKNIGSLEKNIKLRDFFRKEPIPRLNVNAKYLMEKFNLKEGKELGEKLKKIEDYWINNSFSIKDKEIEKIVKD